MTDARTRNRSATGGPIITDATLGSVIKDLFDRLCGEDAQMWFAALKRFLRKEDPWGKFPAWKVVETGIYATHDDLRTAMTTGDRKITTWAEGLLAEVTLATTRQRFELVLVSAAQLCLDKGGTIAQIVAAGKAFGLQLCTAELVGEICKEHRNQKKGEVLRMAMEPTFVRRADLRVFVMIRAPAAFYVDGYGGRSDDFYDANTLWVFCRPIVAESTSAPAE